MLEQKTKSIDGITYRVSQVGGKRALKMFTTLAKMLAPALAKAAESMPTGGFKSLSTVDLSSLNIGTAVEALVDRLDEPKITEIIDTLAGVTECNDGGDKWPQLSGVFDIHFAGKMSSLFKWLAFALEVQFGDFFDAFGSLAQKVGSPKSAGQASASPSISSGQSGAA